MRIAITPLIAVLIWSDVAPFYYQLALYLYTIASVTDYVDGYIARRLKVESPFGEMLDPIADKLLIAAVLLACQTLLHPIWAGAGQLIAATIQGTRAERFVFLLLSFLTVATVFYALFGGGIAS